jgi:lipopolysaccharide biosynthesis protein
MANKIAVLLWLYHTDLWDEFYSKLHPIKDHIHLYLGLEQFSDSVSVVDVAKDSFPDLHISFHDNCGGDILPFIRQISNLPKSHEVFLKLHSKKSSLCRYVNWRSVLLQSYIGDSCRFLKNTSRFRDQKIGSICNKSLLMHNHENTNSAKIQELCSILNIDYNSYGNGDFCAGSMFFGRTNLFQKYFNKHNLLVLEKLLSEEKGRVDDRKEGKYCHSLERIFGYLVRDSNLSIKYSIEDTIKILNPLAPDKRLHMIRLDDNECYIQEDACVYGNILFETDSSIVIRWLHLKPIITREYKKLNNNTLVKLNDKSMDI